MNTELAAKTCVPCRGGIPPLSLTEASRRQEAVPDWQLLDEGRRLERRFTFRNFREALDFVVAVGGLAEAENHHPDISLGWGQATVSWQTHKIQGLHENDFIMAAKTDGLAAARSP